MIIAMAGFAGAWPAAGLALEGVSIVTVSALRWLIALVPLAIWLLCFSRSPLNMILHSRQDVLLVTALAATAVVGYSFAWLGGISLAPANDGVFLVPASMPVFAAAIGALMLHEHIGRARIVGISIGLSGVAVIVSGAGGIGHTPQHLMGDVLFVLTGGLWAGYLAIYRAAASRIDPVVSMTLAGTIGVLVMMPIVLISANPFHGLLAEGASVRWLALAYLGIGGTGVPILLTFLAVQRSGVVSVAQFGLLIPAFAVLLNAALLGEVLGFPQLVGGGIAVSGVAYASVRR